jgi:hypothetical protein
MIVKPHFFGHWKTRALIRDAGIDAAWSLLRLWAHCEDMRSWKFPTMTSARLAAIVEWTRDGDLLQILIDHEWLDETPDGGVEVHGFSEHNAWLASNWDNARFGVLGGRKGKPLGSQCVPSGAPVAPHDKPLSYHPSHSTHDKSVHSVDVSTLEIPLPPTAPAAGTDGLKSFASGIGRTDGQPTPDAGQLATYLDHDPRFASMPRALAKRAIAGWLKTVGKNGRSRDGELVVDMLASFRSYAEAAWANARKTA